MVFHVKGILSDFETRLKSVGCTHVRIRVSVVMGVRIPLD